MPIPTTVTDQIRRDEGLRLTLYKDSLGFETIGYGHCFTKQNTPSQPTCTLNEAEAWLNQDIQTAYLGIGQQLLWIFDIGEIRRAVFINMAFNLGLNGLMKFQKTLAAAKCGDYAEAAAEMLQSKWARQVPERAARLAKQLETNEWQ